MKFEKLLCDILIHEGNEAMTLNSKNNISRSIAPRSFSVQYDFNNQKPKTEDLRNALAIVNTSINHEINNALTPIFFIASYLQKNSHDPEIKFAMDMIMASSNKIKHTVENIRELQKKETIATTEYIHGLLMLDI